MNLVNEKQSRWIFGKANELVNKYSICFPVTDDDWAELRNDAEKIIQDSKGDPLCVKIILSIISYFDLVYRENMKESD